jgi:hypothetical protein
MGREDPEHIIFRDAEIAWIDPNNAEANFVIPPAYA